MAGFEHPVHGGISAARDKIRPPTVYRPLSLFLLFSYPMTRLETLGHLLLLLLLPPLGSQCSGRFLRFVRQTSRARVLLSFSPLFATLFIPFLLFFLHLALVRRWKLRFTDLCLAGMKTLVILFKEFPDGFSVTRDPARALGLPEWITGENVTRIPFELIDCDFGSSFKTGIH